jgi:SPP1 family holin
MNEVKRIDVGTIVRTTLLALALLNQTLVLSGFSPLPFEDELVENLITIVFTVVTSAWSWWKNNDITRKARRNESK